MTDIVLDARTRAMTVGELLDRTADGPVRLIDPSGAPRGELAAAQPFPGGFRAGIESHRSPTGRPREGSLTGDEMRAHWRARLAERNETVAGEPV